MEFPGLGKRCTESTCRQLDFLPVKCDACKQTFCMEHYKYESHNCPAAYQKNVQVPVCPLCNAIIPGKSDELPDIRVSRHIDSDCQSDRAVNHRKLVYSNRCSCKGCKQKELIPVVCDQCGLNFCLRHRHPQDHSCTQLNSKPLGKAALAAMARKPQSTTVQKQKGQAATVTARGTSSLPNTNAPRPSTYNQSSIQGTLSEDAALQLALQASMAGTGSSGNLSAAQLTQEQQDFLLAQAIAQSEQEARNHRGGAGSSGQNQNRRNCNLS